MPVTLPIKALKWHIDACDMSDPLVIPDLVYPILAYLVEDCWGKRQTTGANSLNSWGKLDIVKCRDLQLDPQNYGVGKDPDDELLCCVAL